MTMLSPLGQRHGAITRARVYILIHGLADAYAALQASRYCMPQSGAIFHAERSPLFRSRRPIFHIRDISWLSRATHEAIIQNQ